MRFCSLGSGSGGNATVVETGHGASTRRLLIDCGFSLRELALRLARVGLDCTDLHAVFITHEHGDHVGCATTLARRHGVPLWMSRGTWRAIGEPELPGLLHFARDGQAIDIGGLQLTPFTVAHDAQEPLQLRCSDGARHLGVLTDVGSITPHLLAQAGLRYVADWGNDDRPYVMQTEPPLLSVPNQAEWDDVQMIWHRKVHPAIYRDTVLEAFRRLHADGASSGTFFGLHIHPWLMGMPHRIGMLETIIETIAAASEVWRTTAGAVTDHAAGANAQR